MEKSFAVQCSEICADGGSVEQISVKMIKAAKKCGCRMNMKPGAVRGHIRWAYASKSHTILLGAHGRKFWKELDGFYTDEEAEVRRVELEAAKAAQEQAAE